MKRSTCSNRYNIYKKKNELVSKYLTRENIPHSILNAKNHEREGEIIASAGKKEL